MEVRPEDLPVDPLDGVEHVVMVAPVDPEEHEAQHVAQEDRQKRPKRAEASAPRGTRSSSTMIVMRIAITPSLNASSRFRVMRGSLRRLRALFRGGTTGRAAGTPFAAYFRFRKGGES